jgi:F0F1-type ATP synthase assembly protein I
MPDDNESDKDRREKAKAYDALGLAFLFPACIIGGFLIGYGLDRFFGKEMIFKIIFAILGSAAAFVQLFRFGKSSDGR